MGSSSAREGCVVGKKDDGLDLSLGLQGEGGKVIGLIKTN